MYLIKRILIVIFVVTAINAVYSQKKEQKCYSFDRADALLHFVSRDTTLYLYTDSNIVNGLTVYTDSIRVDISPKTNDYRSGFLDNEFVSYKIHYPIPLTENSLFKKAIYSDDYRCFLYLAPYKNYVILSSDGKYINYAFLGEKDGDLYTKYDPLNKDNSGIVMRIKKKEIWHWVTQEKSKKDEIVSIVKKGNVYIVKSFSN